MLNFQALEQYYNFTTTLKDSSFDSANEIYLTDLPTEVYDFDKIKDEYVNRIIENNQCLYAASFRSNDALYRKENRLVFIEFKDGNIGYELQKNGDSRLADIERKIYDSLFLFCDITDQHISDTRKYMTYILVYNPEKNEDYIQGDSGKTSLEANETQYSRSYEKIFKHVGKYTSKKNPDFFGLRKRVSALYFSALHVYDKEEFSRFLEELEM